MPHIIVKIWPGGPEEEKHALANKILIAVTETMNVPEKSVSVAFEEISHENWAKEVFIPDIINKDQTIYIKPGYIPSELKTKVNQD
jgi:4-oxalocrotonate tautomerase